MSTSTVCIVFIAIIKWWRTKEFGLVLCWFWQLSAIITNEENLFYTIIQNDVDILWDFQHGKGWPWLMIVSNIDIAEIVFGGFCQSSKPSENTTSTHPSVSLTGPVPHTLPSDVFSCPQSAEQNSIGSHHSITWQNTTTSSYEQGVYISMSTQEVTCEHLLPNMEIGYKTHPTLLKAAKPSIFIPPHHNEYNSKHHSHKGNHKQRKPNVGHLLQKRIKRR